MMPTESNLKRQAARIGAFFLAGMTATSGLKAQNDGNSPARIVDDEFAGGGKGNAKIGWVAQPSDSTARMIQPLDSVAIPDADNDSIATHHPGMAADSTVIPVGSTVMESIIAADSTIVASDSVPGIKTDSVPGNTIVPDSTVVAADSLGVSAQSTLAVDSAKQTADRIAFDISALKISDFLEKDKKDGYPGLYANVFDFLNYLSIHVQPKMKIQTVEIEPNLSNLMLGAGGYSPAKNMVFFFDQRLPKYVHHDFENATGRTMLSQGAMELELNAINEKILLAVPEEFKHQFDDNAFSYCGLTLSQKYQLRIHKEIAAKIAFLLWVLENPDLDFKYMDFKSQITGLSPVGDVANLKKRMAGRAVETLDSAWVNFIVDQAISIFVSADAQYEQQIPDIVLYETGRENLAISAFLTRDKKTWRGDAVGFNTIIKDDEYVFKTKWGNINILTDYGDEIANKIMQYVAKFMKNGTFRSKMKELQSQSGPLDDLRRQFAAKLGFSMESAYDVSGPAPAPRPNFSAERMGNNR